MIGQIASAFGLEEARLQGRSQRGASFLTFHLATRQGDFALQKKRGSSTKISARAEEIRLRLEGQHALMSYLSTKGFPVAPPLQTKDQSTSVTISGVSYALYPYVAGRPMEPGNVRQVMQAAAALASFHSLTTEYRGPMYLFLDPFPRMFQKWLSDFHKDAEALEGSSSALGIAGSMKLFKDSLPGIEGALRSLPYDTLPKAVIHGDYKKENLLFRGEELAAVIDFVRSRYEARALDLATFIPCLVHSSYDKTFSYLVRVFITTYQSILPLEESERRALAVLIQARVALKAFRTIRRLVKKTDARKKLKKARRFREFVDNLEWLRGEWPAFQDIFLEEMDLK